MSIQALLMQLKKTTVFKESTQKTPARHLLRDIREEKMQIAEINPQSLKTVSTQELLNLHLRTHQLWANFGPDETVFNAHLFILHEMLTRGLQHRIENLDALDRVTFEKNPKLLEEFRLLNGDDRQKVADLSPEIRKILEELPDMTLIPGYISVTGSSVYPEVTREPNDIDLVVRSQIQNPVAEFKLLRFFQQLTDKPLHWVYAPEGPCYTHVPLYDLMLRKRDPLRVETVDPYETRRGFYKSNVEPLKPFAPYDVAGEFYVGENEDVLKEWVEDRLPVIVQEKYDGLRILVHKKGDQVALITEDELRDRAEMFPELVQKVKEIPHDSFILDTEFVEHTEEGRTLPRAEMTWIATAKPGQGDYAERAKRIVVNVHDLLYLDGEDLTQTPYTNRLEKLVSLGLPEPPFHLAESKLVENIDDLDEALDWACSFEGSEGAMIKAANFLYTPGRPDPDVAKYKVVHEIDCIIIGWRKAPKARPADEHWTVAEAHRRLPRLLEESNTYFFRCAIKAGDELIPIESRSRLAPSDVHFRWDEDKQTWVGNDDPSVWHMAPGWEDRDVGEYRYGATYAISLDETPEFGTIITVAPTKFTPFEKEDEEGNFDGYGYSWTFPRVRNVKPDGAPAQLNAVLRAFGYDPRKFGKPSSLTKQEPDTEEERPENEVLTHDEQRRLAETQFGDPYMIHQKDAEVYPFVVQQHTRGILSPKQLEAANEAYEKAKDDKDAWTSFVKEYEIETFVDDAPVDDLINELRDTLEEARTNRNVQRVLSRALRPAPFGTPKERLIQRGNAHMDLRLKSPDGEYLVGWTLDTPSIALQFLDGKIVWPMRNKFTEYDLEYSEGAGIENILAQRKSVQPSEWLEYVKPDKTPVELEPQEVGATAGTGARYDYIGSGNYVAGVQKSDYHEYFLFFNEDHLKKLNGRWGVQLITGPFTDIGRYAWIFNRPKTQVPYIATHDRQKEEDKAKREHVKMIWNEDTLKALEKVGFNPAKERQHVFDETAYNKYRGIGRDALVATVVPLENVDLDTLKLFRLAGWEGLFEVVGDFKTPIPDTINGGTRREGTVALIFDPKIWSKTDALAYLTSLGYTVGLTEGGRLLEVLEDVAKRRVVQFCKIDDEKRLVTGVVLEPFKVDTQGDWETPEDIEKAMLSFMENSRPIGFMHSEMNRKLRLIENYLAPTDMTLGKQFIVKGSWIMTTKVYDDEIWQLIKAGKITGYSIAGRGKRVDASVGSKGGE